MAIQKFLQEQQDKSAHGIDAGDEEALKGYKNQKKRVKQLLKLKALRKKVHKYIQYKRQL